MTEYSEATLPVELQGNSSTTVFSPGIYAAEASDIKVVLFRADNTTAELVLNVDYSLANLGFTQHFTLTYPISGDPLPTGDSLKVYRNTANETIYNVPAYSGFNSTDLNEAFFLVNVLLAERISQYDFLSAIDIAEAAAAAATYWGGVAQYWGQVAVDAANLAVLTSTQIVPYASRALAELADVPEEANMIHVLEDGMILEYIKDVSGTALTTGDGANWSPGGLVATPEHFGCDGTGTTDCTTELQAFVDWVTENKKTGVGLGAYVTSDTIEVGDPYVDGLTNTDSITGFFLSIGRTNGVWTGTQNTTGIIYKGTAGAGSAPDEVKPIIAFHNANFYNLGNIVVSQPKGIAKAGICGIRFTGSDGKQTGNAVIDLLAAYHCERGIVIGLNDYDGTDHDCWEKVVVGKVDIGQTRHPFYMSSNTSDGSTFHHITISAYNNGANGPDFYVSGGATYETDKAFFVEQSGNISFNNIEIAQLDMLADGSGDVMDFGAGTHVVHKATLEVSNAIQLRTSNAANGRNAKIFENIFTSTTGYVNTGTGDEPQYTAVKLTGDARLVNCTFAGNVLYLRNFTAIGCNFHYDGVTFRNFVGTGAEDKTRVTIIGTRWAQSNQPSEALIQTTIPYAGLNEPVITGGSADDLDLTGGTLSGMEVLDGLNYGYLSLSGTLNSGVTPSELVLNNQAIPISRLHKLMICTIVSNVLVGVFHLYIHHDASSGAITSSALVTEWASGSYAAPAVTFLDNGDGTYDLTLENTEANAKRFQTSLLMETYLRDEAA